MIELADQGDVEGAFNLMERLSELERFHRTAFVFRMPYESDPDFYRKMYPRLQTIRELKNRLESVKGSEAEYLTGRIREEEKLVKLKTGSDLEKLPQAISMISDKTMRRLDRTPVYPIAVSWYGK